MISDLSEAQIQQVLRSEVVGRIGCYAEGQTYVVPVAYVYDDGYIYAHSGLGLKIEMMRANPHICFEVDHVDNLVTWQSVIAWGTYEELEGEEAENGLHLLVGRLQPLMPEQTGHAHDWNGHGGSTRHILDRSSRHGVVYRIRLQEKTGRSETS